METITLIANTGIQLLTKRIVFSQNTGKTLRFCEYFDPFDISMKLEYAILLKQSGETVPFIDLWKGGYVDMNGELTVPECDVLRNPFVRVINDDDVIRLRWGSRNCLADKYFGQWIPIPYFELEQDKFKLGPSNWCRCKIIPDRQQLEDGSLTATMVLAFDTRTLFDQVDDDPESPVFNDEREKTYRFCNSIISTMDFCSGKSNKILECLMEQAHGVCCWEDIPISHPKQHRLAFFASYLWLMDYIANNVDLPEVRLYGCRDQEVIPVEMDINIGDSKTSVRLSEDRGLSKTFRITESEPLAIQDFTDMVNPDGSLNRAQQPFDMRIAFQLADFGWKLPCSRQFVWPSMVRLGEEAQKLTIQAENQKTGNASLSTFSNPQQYLWDDNAVKEEWHCVNRVDGWKRYPYVDGISNYFQDDGCIDKDGLGFGFGSHYSHKALMTFVFMEMIAQAMAQINSHDYRMKKRRRGDRARIIDTVFISCPAGMSKTEQLSMHKCLEDACFVLGQFYNYSSTAIASRQVEIIQNKPPETNFFVLMDEKLEPADSCIITPIQNCGRIVVDSFPQYIGYKEDESSACLVKPFYVLGFNEKMIVEQVKWGNELTGLSNQNLDMLVEQFKNKLLSRCPLTFTLYRPDFREDKEKLMIDFVEGEDGDPIPPKYFKLSVRSCVIL